MEVKKILMEFIHDNYSINREGTITEEMDLIEDLKLDSIEIFNLLTDVEEMFGIQFDDVDLLTDNFAKIKDFTKIIEKEIYKRDDIMYQNLVSK